MKRGTAVIHWMVTCSATAATSTASSHRSRPICPPATPSTSQSCEGEEGRQSGPTAQVIWDTTEASEPQPLSSGLACCPKAGLLKRVPHLLHWGSLRPLFPGTVETWKQIVQLTRGHWCLPTAEHLSKQEGHRKTSVLVSFSVFFFFNVIHSCALTEAAKDSLALWGLEAAAAVGIRKAREWTATFQRWLDLNAPSMLCFQSGFSCSFKDLSGSPAEGYAKDTQHHEMGLTTSAPSSSPGTVPK